MSSQHWEWLHPSLDTSDWIRENSDQGKPSHWLRSAHQIPPLTNLDLTLMKRLGQLAQVHRYWTCAIRKFRATGSVSPLSEVENGESQSLREKTKVLLQRGQETTCSRESYTPRERNRDRNRKNLPLAPLAFLFLKCCISHSCVPWDARVSFQKSSHFA